MAKGKKSKSRVISRQGGPARAKTATTAPPPVDEPVAADEPVVADGTGAMADWSTPRPERADRTVKQPIFGGEDADLPDPQDAKEVIAKVDQEAEEDLERLRRVLELSISQRGEDDPSTLRARADITMRLWQMGRFDEAIELEKQLVEDSARVLGEEHPETLTARANLASSYWSSGSTDRAIAIEEAVLADAERLLGLDHLATLTARSNLAFSYSSAGRREDAVEVQRQVVERIVKADGRHVFFRCGEGVLLLFNADATRNPPAPDARLPVPPHGTVGQGHLCFAATGEEITRWKARLSERGVTIEADFEWPNGGRSDLFSRSVRQFDRIRRARIWGF